MKRVGEYVAIVVVLAVAALFVVICARMAVAVWEWHR